MKIYKFGVEEELGHVINLVICWTLFQGQVVKKGQVVCYLEQLGTQQPVEVIVRLLEPATNPGGWSTT
jgi:hypothetical protein